MLDVGSAFGASLVMVSMLAEVCGLVLWGCGFPDPLSPLISGHKDRNI
jgi:hypothetical protein